MDQRIVDLEKKVEKLDYTINGINGDNGLRSEVKIILAKV